MLTRLLRKGVTIEICTESLEITPDAGDPVFRTLALLDNQQRALHAVRTHGPEVKAGRKAVLKDEQWTEIKAMLAEKSGSPGAVASRLGVGRTTLFNFIRRMKAAEDSTEEAIE